MADPASVDGDGAADVELAVVVPVHGNRATLAPLVDRLHAALDGAGVDHRVVLVDDACPDGSGEAADRLADDDARVVAVHHAARGGQHRAVLTGLARARAAWVAVMDADLQDPPEALPALLAAARAGDAVVFAGRRGRYQRAGRRLTSALYRLVLPVFVGVPRDAGMFFVAPRRVVARLLAMEVPSPQVVAMLGFAGAPLRSLPVERAPRAIGASAYTGRRRIASAAAALGTAVRLHAASPRLGRLDAAVAVLVAVAALAVLGPAVARLPYDLGDEGYLGYLAWRLAEGEAPYRDVELWSYLPGQLYLLSWVWEASAEPIAGIRRAWVALFAAGAAVLYLLGATWGVRRAALVVALALVLVPGPWDRSPLPLLHLSLLAAALASQRPRGRPEPPFLALGVLLAAGIWLRADFAALAAATLVVCLAFGARRRGSRATWRAAAAAGVGIVAGVAPLVAILARDGVVRELVAQLAGYVDFAAERNSAWYRLERPPLSSIVDLTIRGAVGPFYYASLLVPPALAAVVVADLRRGTPRFHAALHVLVALWLAGNLPQYLHERPDLAHLAQRAFALLAVGLWVLATLPHGRARRLVAATGTLLLAAYVAVHAGRWTRGTPWYLANRAAPVTLANGVAFVARHPAVAPLLHRVLATTPHDAPVATLPFAPGYNVLLRRPLPGPQIYLLPHSLLRPGAEARYVADLARRDVPYLLVAESFRLNEKDDSALPAYAPELWAFVENRYEPVDRRAGVALYRLASRPDG